MTNISDLILLNAGRWAKCSILPSRLTEVQAVAVRLAAANAKTVYQQIEMATKVPWWVVAVIHERECSQNFSLGLAQGDPWNQVSTHVPRGIGPFTTFTDAAVFALVRCAPYAAKWTDWSAGGAMTLLELYNGTGYEDYHNEASPYDWGATSIEQEGKYVADGIYNPNVWDTQIGCAAMINAMMALDSTIQFSIPVA